MTERLVSLQHPFRTKDSNQGAAYTIVLFSFNIMFPMPRTSHLAQKIREHIDWILVINFSFELLKLTDTFDSTLIKIECTGISIEVKQEKSVISVLPVCFTIEACSG